MKKRLAVIKVGGLASGGCEKYLQTIVMSLPRDEFDVDYFFTDSFPTDGTDWIHPGTDPKRVELMQRAGINLFEIAISHREAGYPGRWMNTDLFKYFDESKYDVLLTVTKGEPEWPFCEMKKVAQVETIHGSTFDSGASTEAKAFVLLAEWQMKRWAERGGPTERAVIIPSLVQPAPRKESHFREKLNIPADAFVIGMHQATRDDIFSPVPLEAFSQLQKVRPDAHFILLGGSERYKRQANTLNLKNIHFVNFDSSPTFISEVLGALDVYAHGRADGEVCSACIIEALLHDLPIVSVFGINNGHVEQILGAGVVVATVPDYAANLIALANDPQLRKRWSAGARHRYESAYQFDVNLDRMIDVIRTVSRGESLSESRR